METLDQRTQELRKALQEQTDSFQASLETFKKATSKDSTALGQRIDDLDVYVLSSRSVVAELTCIGQIVQNCRQACERGGSAPRVDRRMPHDDALGGRIDAI